ncbi:hypothetical protein HMPREF0378_0801 [Eubacterium nodatum ATCC 33099]|nr:hypothetical protein HMPREF0378_0801 [Eubacterium nodatum ATCC 33099]
MGEGGTAVSGMKPVRALSILSLKCKGFSLFYKNTQTCLFKNRKFAK